MLHETHIVEPKNVGLYIWRGEGLKKCTVCTLMKMLTFLYGPLPTELSIPLIMHAYWYVKCMSMPHYTLHENLYQFPVIFIILLRNK